MLAREPGDGRVLRLEQPPRDLAARQRLERCAGAEREQPRQPRSLFGRPVGIGRRHAFGDVERDEHAPLDDGVEGLGGDRLEQGEHQHGRRGQPESEQAEASPPRDEPPLLAVEDHEQDQGEHAGRDPEPAQPAPRQQQPPPSEQVERHGELVRRAWWTARHLGPESQRLSGDDSGLKVDPATPAERAILAQKRRYTYTPSTLIPPN